MRRPPQGATIRPGPRGPGNGYGRWVGRPGPRLPIVAAVPIEPVRFLDADSGATRPDAVPAPVPPPLDPAATP
jgi:hypothetical protein